MMGNLPDINIIAINTSTMRAYASEGLGKITGFLDKYGDETSDPAKWSIAVIKWDFGGWSTAPLSEYTSKSN